VLAETLFTAVGLSLCRRLDVGGIDWPRLARAALAAAVMAAALWPARGLAPPLLAVVAAATTGLYLALCVVLGAVSREEVQRFREACIGVSTELCGVAEQ
jgi:hypothetical protein